MSTYTAITEEMTHDLDIALTKAKNGQRDFAAMKRVVEEMRRSSEETRAKIGIVNFQRRPHLSGGVSDAGRRTEMV
jgi:hypothetical protein